MCMAASLQAKPLFTHTSIYGLLSAKENSSLFLSLCVFSIKFHADRSFCMLHIGPLRYTLCFLWPRASWLVWIRFAEENSEWIPASGDLCCLTNPCSWSQCVGGGWLAVNWFQTQMVEVHSGNARSILRRSQQTKRAHPSLRGAPRFGSLGSMRVDDSSSKLGSSICTNQQRKAWIIWYTRRVRPRKWLESRVFEWMIHLNLRSQQLIKDYLHAARAVKWKRWRGELRQAPKEGVKCVQSCVEQSNSWLLMRLKGKRSHVSD